MDLGFDLIADNNTKILIIGSFPSDDSLKEYEKHKEKNTNALPTYYAGKSNGFWYIIGHVIGEGDISSRTYDEKYQLLLKNGIGLWDIFEQRERKEGIQKGSSDNKIDVMKSIPNKFYHRLREYKNIKYICLNCDPRYSIYFKVMGYEVFHLPSSSGANSKNGDKNKKIKKWSEVLVPLFKKY